MVTINKKQRKNSLHIVRKLQMNLLLGHVKTAFYVINLGRKIRFSPENKLVPCLGKQVANIQLFLFRGTKDVCTGIKFEIRHQIHYLHAFKYRNKYFNVRLKKCIIFLLLFKFKF